MPGLDGMALLKAVGREDPQLPVIILTAHGSVDNAVEAVKLGAFDYLEKPFDRDQIRHVLQRAVATRAVDGASLGAQPPPVPDAPPDPSSSRTDPISEVGMIGQSGAIHDVLDIIRTAAASPSTVLIT